MTRAERATKIACYNRKQKSYRVNRPLRNQHSDARPTKTALKNKSTEILNKLFRDYRN